MRQGKLSRYLRTVLVSTLVVLALAAQGGCQSRSETATDYVGFPKSFADLAQRVKPAVVNISSTSEVTIPGGPFSHFFGPGQEGQNGALGKFFKNFFNQMPDKKVKQQSLGSGFIIDKDGLILTNNHVVDNAQEIKVKLSDGREFKAKVIGRDKKTDLALIKISSSFENLPVLALGDSGKMRVG